MKIKVNRSLVPIKAHYFFFFAALGPVLPQLNVFGRQLGVSAAVMGMVTAVLPLLWAAAKPLFGYVVDFWPNYRKLVFMLLITLMTGSYCGLWIIPQPEPTDITDQIHQYVYKLNNTINLEKYDSTMGTLDNYSCYWSCNAEKKFNVYLKNFTFLNTIYIDVDDKHISCSLLDMEAGYMKEKGAACSPKENCNLMCFEDENLPAEINATNNLKVQMNRTKRDVAAEKSNANNLEMTVDKSKEKLGTKQGNFDDFFFSSNSSDMSTEKLTKKEARIFTQTFEKGVEGDNFYMTAPFWVFVVLMCVGTVAFNVANCIGDAVCFDVLGAENAPKYGSQRAFGTAGYGITALLGGWLIDRASGPGARKDFTPAFVIALACTAADLYSCRALTLPSLTSPEDSGKALRAVLKIPRVLLFIAFAVVAGTFDSFIIYYMFWFLEELAEQTGSMGQIKLIEGVVVAGESFVGEIIFFALSGKIINRWGYGTTMTVSLLCYGVRMALISCIQHPWQLVAIESVMQGPTYALCYSAIVGYAAHVAPEGYSATVQGIVGGMDDGVGFAIGSLLGGLLYSHIGARASFRLLATVACGAAAIHAAVFALLHRKTAQIQVEPVEEGEKMLPLDSGAIYRDTVVPISDSVK